MAINLFKFKESSLFREKKKQRYLVFALVAIILLALLFAIYNFLKPPVPVGSESSKIPEINVNFEFLENKDLKNLSPFEEVSEFHERLGRENPFIPY